MSTRAHAALIIIVVIMSERKVLSTRAEYIRFCFDVACYLSGTVRKTVRLLPTNANCSYQILSRARARPRKIDEGVLLRACSGFTTKLGINITIHEGKRGRARMFKYHQDSGKVYDRRRHRL